MNKIEPIVRILFGIMLVVFGANKFLGFMAPPQMEGEAMEFMMQIMNAGYFMPIIGIVLLASGTWLITGKMKGFALLLLAPIILNILLFHIRFMPGSMTMAILMTAAVAFLMYANKTEYASLCTCKKKK